MDIGTGSGVLAIVACMQGASRVYILDTNPAANDAALDNADLNNLRDRLVHLPLGDTIVPLPPGETVDVIVSNPAQLPLPKAAEPNNPYYSGPDGRRLIDQVISEAPAKLSQGGRLLIVLNSVMDFPKSLELMESSGLKPQVLVERLLELRPLFDRDWLDELGGVPRGLYSIRDGRAYETIYSVEARLQ